MKQIIPYLERGIRHFTYSYFIVVVLFLLFAFVRSNQKGEAYIGDFSSQELSNDWIILKNDVELGQINLPNNVSCVPGDELTIINTLPQNVTDGMKMMIRTAMQDVNVYIDDKLRQNYASKNLDNVGYYTPSAYVLTSLTSEDAGKELKICYEVKSVGTLETVFIGNGNNAWFDVIYKNIPLVMISFLSIFLGTIVSIFYIFLRGKININKSMFYLGLLIDMMGIWILSESKLRQLIFARPSLTNIFCYLSVEIIGVLVVLFFDEVQHRHYHKIYLIMEAVISTQVIINVLLNVFGIVDFHNTLVFTHVEILVGIIIAVINICNDIKIKEINRYSFVAVGMILFLVLCIAEILSFYLSQERSFGTYLCGGLILLLIATIIQMLADVTAQYRLREKQQQESWISTIETIASTIDAKDEYTGGHSNRVGRYASILAREMAIDYDFSEDDINRIHYIGLMHDIGKIGVADTILNKTGRLTDEEFTLMKKHVDIGHILLASMNENMEGLLDGIKYHHERFDGKGYPSGLEGTDIPLIARILCLADCYDAMTSNRIYRRRLSDAEVREEIVKCSGTQFDPALAEIFIRLMDRGDIYPVTLEGMEVNSKGKTLKSSLLEDRLQKDVESGVHILNPSHVRMASYIMKLSEYKNIYFEVFLVKGNEILSSYLSRNDINIQYTEECNLVVLMGRTKQEADMLCKQLSKEANIEHLDKH